MKHEEYELIKAINNKKEKRVIEKESELEKKERERIASLPENIAKQVLNQIDRVLETKMLQAMENLTEEISKKDWQNKFGATISFYLSNDISAETQKIILDSLVPMVDKFIPEAIKDDIKVSAEYKVDNVYDDSDPNDFGWDAKKVATYYIIIITLSINFE